MASLQVPLWSRLQHNHAQKALILFLFALMLIRANALPQATSESATLISPQSVKWLPSPVLRGAEVAVMDGDPKKPGSLYTLRLKLPDAYTIPLHWHPDTERLTVLSGVVLFGTGNRMDPRKTTALGPGSYIIIPATIRHWVTARGTTIFQVGGVAPFVVNFIK